MHAVITTYEMVVLDSPHLRDVDWKCLIIDEAHRLKNNSCKLVESLRAMQLVSCCFVVVVFLNYILYLEWC